MLHVLLESRARPSRRLGSTLTSALVHGALVAGAVALTLPGSVRANPARPKTPDVVYVPIAKRAGPTAAPAARRQSDSPPLPVPPTVPVPKIFLTTLPPIDVGPAIPPDQIRIGGSGSRFGEPSAPPGGWPAPDAGAVFSESVVDRAPRLIGPAAAPRYPAALREAGVQGRVLVQFVVDTAGRAELAGLEVVETAHPAFAESVRNALATYRFTPGEAAGRRVRTRVQVPFEFVLRR
jgi:protein TonB